MVQLHLTFISPGSWIIVTHTFIQVRQCIIYDSDKPNARLIGIEYIISRRLFNSLPDEEKPMWHSHMYEVSPTLYAEGKALGKGPC